MKKTIFLSLLAFVLSLCLPAPRQKSEQTSPGNLSAPLHAVSEAVHNEEALPRLVGLQIRLKSVSLPCGHALHHQGRWHISQSLLEVSIVNPSILV